MGIDTMVLLQVRDRRALREAFDAHAAAERKRWADDGREAEYDTLGHDPTPLMYPLSDGGVSIFTGLRFHDSDMEFAIRCWLHEYLGDRIAQIHDDARGVFVFPDVCEPRAKTYDGILAEIGEAGRFIEPKPPTAEEHAERARQLEEYIAAMDAVREAQASGDAAAIEAALAASPESVRQTFRAQERFARMAGFGAEVDETPAPRLRLIEGGGGGEDPPRVALGAIAEELREMMGLPASAEIPNDEEGIAKMFERFVGDQMLRDASSALGDGRVSMLLPSDLSRAIERARVAHPDRAAALDIQERIELADGSAVLVTSRLGENVMEAMNLAELAEAAGIDRAAFGEIPFFGENVAAELAVAESFEAARDLLGDRCEMLALRTTEEWIADEKSKTSRWLDDDA